MEWGSQEKNSVGMDLNLRHCCGLRIMCVCVLYGYIHVYILASSTEKTKK